MELDNWRPYLPTYHFPSFLRTCFTCLAVSLLGVGILIFIILPAIFNYINSLDEEPIFDTQVGSFLDLGMYRLEVLVVENDTRCPRETFCSAQGSATIRFRNTWDQAKHSIQFSEEHDISDAVSLPLGYVVRIIELAPESASPQNTYTLRFQIFRPPDK